MSYMVVWYLYFI